MAYLKVIFFIFQTQYFPDKILVNAVLNALLQYVLLGHKCFIYGNGVNF